MESAEKLASQIFSLNKNHQSNNECIQEEIVVNKTESESSSQNARNNPSESQHDKKKKQGFRHRIGDVLSVKEDFFAFAFISKLSHVHLQVVLF